MHYVELDEEMDMPCLCDCGEWFDLNDGYGTKVPGRNKVVCPSCHKSEMLIVDEIEDIKDDIDYLEEQGNKKREIKKLQTRLSKLKAALESGAPLE